MYPKKAKYTRDHEWIRKQGDVYVVGITAYAAEQLGDVTYVELPTEGAEVEQGDTVATVESVKAASDVYAPAGGRVCEVNEALEGAPELVNQSPHEAGWFFKLEEVSTNDLRNLMDAGAYEEYVEGLHE